MRLLDIPEYREDVRNTAELSYDWNKLRDKKLLLVGGTGQIGSFMADVLMYRNRYKEQNCKVYIVCRNATKAGERFSEYAGDEHFEIIPCDINKDTSALSALGEIDYILHAASNTHPLAYAQTPVETITTNVIGAVQLLRLAKEKGTKRFLFVSSVEIYGENRGDTTRFDEKYCGYLDCNSMRAGYPEAKRVTEALCQAYIAQENMDIVIARLSRVYGPTLLTEDSKAMTQFLRKGAAGENIVLKSEGTQQYSYAYVADAVSALLFCLFYGASGEAYNIADPQSDIMLKEIAGHIASLAGTEVVFELPDDKEQKGYSTATKALLDCDKIIKAGWKPRYSVETGIGRTISALRQMHAE